MKCANHSSRPATATRTNGLTPHIQSFGQKESQFANEWAVPRTLELQEHSLYYPSTSQRQIISYPHPIRHYLVPSLSRDARFPYKKESINSHSSATKFITLAFKPRFASKRNMLILLKTSTSSLAV